MSPARYQLRQPAVREPQPAPIRTGTPCQAVKPDISPGEKTMSRDEGTHYWDLVA